MNPDELNGTPTDGATAPVDETTNEGQAEGVEEVAPEAIASEDDNAE